MNSFNLIVSTYRFREEEAHDEILDLIESIGDPDAECKITEVKGILLVKTSIEPIIVVEKLREITSTEPWQTRYVLRVIPVSRVVPTDSEDISRAVSDMAHTIGPEDKFRITVEKRHSPIESREVIEAIGAKVERKVDLEHPDWIILVQIVGSLTGVSILRPSQIFSSVLEKRK